MKKYNYEKSWSDRLVNQQPRKTKEEMAELKKWMDEAEAEYDAGLEAEAEYDADLSACKAQAGAQTGNNNNNLKQ